ncbi:unknown [Prevotella sp. CAG:487]|nr:unknown [Prevotella sp. CAG:487]
MAGQRNHVRSDTTVTCKYTKKMPHNRHSATYICGKTVMTAGKRHSSDVFMTQYRFTHTFILINNKITTFT